MKFRRKERLYAKSSQILVMEINKQHNSRVLDKVVSTFVACEMTSKNHRVHKNIAHVIKALKVIR